MPTPKEVLALDTSGLQGVADRAGQIADAIVKVAGTLHKTIHDDLAWQGAAARAAEDKADREQTQIRAIATAYDDLSAACAGAARDLQYPVAEIKTIFQHYVVPPVAVADDWSATGIQDPNSEAGVELSRLSGLVASLRTADAQWSAAIATANDELTKMASAATLTAIKVADQSFKSMDSRADPDRIRTSAAAFQQLFGRPPTTASDWSTAEVLNPNSYTPEFKGVGPEIRVVKITPVPGQGVVRSSQYIEQRDVSDPDPNPLNLNPGARDLGNNRTADPNFDPEHTKVTTYVDYENGIVVMRQNPSVRENDDGSPGEVKVGAPDGRVWQNPDGSVRIQYDAGNPLPPSWMTKPPGLDGHDVTVNGDLVFQPGPNGVQVNGTRTDYPSLEVYQDTPDGRTQTIALDPARSGSSLGPAMNLPFHHDIGVGGAAFGPFTEWNDRYDVPGNPKPSTSFGPVTAPPTAPAQRIPAGTA
ncbi:hypothetical protein C8258_16255 [Nocardia sp. MDA0666]|uniref:hypothetical protein n=1 Tax=Nocardia sp. MDA0666 TaxID=2135448 RepID=UPI000D1279C7|nr:hypothetical protein [Nocardia sp. MDA0666]PSR67181.1 hypothetical protein C8258_16255 [Nocardia sp. MDA0666]